MAKRRTSKQIPPPYSIGKDVFPIVPFRVQFGTGITATGTVAGISSAIQTNDASIVAGNIAADVDLDLDFESNEVFDVMSIIVDVDPSFATTFEADTTDIQFILALTDDPDKAVTTGLHLETVFETDESFVWYCSGKYDSLSGSANPVALLTNYHREYTFIQPWTVARNLRWIYSSFSTAAADMVSQVRIQLWGRRRNASDTEFKAIIYRQRF